MNVTKLEAFNSSTYAVDAVMTLALALNRTLVGGQGSNESLSDAIRATLFAGASVSRSHAVKFANIFLLMCSYCKCFLCS